MLADFLGPLQSQVGTDVGVLAVELIVRALAQGIGGVEEVGVVCGFELVCRVVLCHDAEAAGHLQSLGDHPFEVEVVGDGGVTRAVDGVERGVVERVVVLVALSAVVGIAVALDEIALGVVEAAVGIHLCVLLKRSVGRVVAAVVVDGKFVAELQVSQSVSERDATGEGIAVAAFHGTADAVVHQVDAILPGFVATFEVEAVLLSPSGAYRLSEPVGVDAGLNLPELARVHLVEADLCQGVVGGEQSGAALDLQFFAGVGEVIAAQVGHFHAHAAGVGHAQTAYVGLLRLDDDDAIGGFRAVDSFGGGVFERGDALYLVHVQVENLGELRLKAVEDKQRLVGTGGVFSLHAADCRRAAHLEVGQGVGVAAGTEVLDLHKRRVDVFQALQYVLVAYAAQVIAAHRGDGTGEGVGLAGEGTVDDHLADRLAVGLQYNLVAALACQCHATCLETDIRHLQGVGVFAQRHHEVAVDIGDHHCRSAVAVFAH